MVPLIDLISKKFGYCHVAKFGEQTFFIWKIGTSPSKFTSICSPKILFLYDEKVDMFYVYSEKAWYTTSQFERYLNLLMFS